jgi:AAA+ superfamily predicted ATPase
VPNFNYPDVNLKLLGIDEEKYYKEKEEYEKKSRINERNKVFTIMAYFVHIYVAYAITELLVLKVDNTSWFMYLSENIKWFPTLFRIYTYGMLTYILTSFLTLRRNRLLDPNCESVYEHFKGYFITLCKFLIIPLCIAFFCSPFMPYFGENLLFSLLCYIVYIIVLYGGSLVPFYLSIMLLIIDTEKVKPLQVPFGITEEDKKIIKERRYNEMPKDIAEKLMRIDMKYHQRKEKGRNIKQIDFKETQSVAAAEAEGTEAERTEEDIRREVLQEALIELDSLIGMNMLKIEVKKFLADIQMRKKKEQFGIQSDNSTLHMVFEGPPGTGKTTVARIMGQILYGVGYLETGELHECDRGDLIGEYVGQTAPKVKQIFSDARGGVIFIDEAYSLTPKEGNGFENEAIDTIVKLMEDNRKDTVVIFAGYTNEMRIFLDSNPGLKSRIPFTFTFTPYSSSELYEILMTMLEKNRYTVSPDCVEYLKNCIYELSPYLKKSNAREIRNFKEALIKEQNVRLNEESKKFDFSTEELSEDEKQRIKEYYLTIKRPEIEKAFKHTLAKLMREYTN